jgi:hypothetical protein
MKPLAADMGRAVCSCQHLLQKNMNSPMILSITILSQFTKVRKCSPSRSLENAGALQPLLVHALRGFVAKQRPTAESSANPTGHCQPL